MPNSSKFDEEKIEPREREEVLLVKSLMTQQLPKEYNDTRFVLMVRDPEWIFSYWELSDKTRIEYGLERDKHKKKLVIRLYDITGINFDGKNARDFVDIEVNDFTNNWYIRVPEANHMYFAELGFLEKKGKFTQIIGSNMVKVPTKTLAVIKEEVWAKVGEGDVGKELHTFKKEHTVENSEEIIKVGNKGSLHYNPSGSSK